MRKSESDRNDTSTAYRSTFLSTPARLAGFTDSYVCLASPDSEAAADAAALLGSPPGVGYRQTGCIPEGDFAVRLENTVVLMEGAPIDLMADIPIEAWEIEELMNRRAKQPKPRR